MENPFESHAVADTAPAAMPLASANRGHFVTAGERKFDRRTYRTLGYYVNVLLSVAAVAAVERTAGGQRFIDGIGNFARTHASALKPKTIDTIEMLARKSFFLAGGFAVLAPMKLLEDRKLPLVKKWNREIYGAQADTDPHIQQSEHELAAAPKQSWRSVFASRMLALVPFYAGYWLLWDRTSPLSKATNGELHAMGNEAIAAMEKTNPAKLSEIAAKGFYIDKPIATASRWIGKGLAKLTNNPEALAKLESLEKNYPGTILSVTKHTPHDPIHSTAPYYFISEAITSAMVAWGVYVLTRVTAPFFDKRTDRTMKPVPWQPSSSAIPITEREDVAPQLAPRHASAPSTQIQAVGIDHQQPQEAALGAAIA
jgi:hypothetical protein